MSDGDSQYSDFDDDIGGTGQRIRDLSIDGRNHDPNGALSSTCPAVYPFATTLLGRMAGNFLNLFSCTDVRMDDRQIHQRPCKLKDPLLEEIARPLRNRPAGVEPLIDHAKAFA